MTDTGLTLARRFYHAELAPRLADVPHAAALLGRGSEVLGFDDAISRDHDFGARVQIFLPEDVTTDSEGLPAEFEGHLTQVRTTTAAGYFTALLGVDPAAGMTMADWLLSPTQVLATLTAGEVFADPHNLLTSRRAALTWYPDDIWRYALAAGWLRVSQEEPFVGRAGGTGDELGSAVIAARLVRELIRLAFLIERRWAPYAKWLGRAFRELHLAASLTPALEAALAATGWRLREAALGRAASILAEATNQLRLAEPQDPTTRPFYTRDIQVLSSERFTEALAIAVTDPPLRALIDDASRRADGVLTVRGTIDQVVDSVDVLDNPARCRASAPALGL